MARLAPVVVPAVLRHVTQRGNRWQETFLAQDDYVAYPTCRINAIGKLRGLRLPLPPGICRDRITAWTHLLPVRENRAL